MGDSARRADQPVPMRLDEASPARARALQRETGGEYLPHGRRRKRYIARSRIQRPDQVGPPRLEKPGHFRHVGPLALRVETMKAADIEGNIERAAEHLQVSHVTNEKFGLYGVLGDPLPRFAYRDW